MEKAENQIELREVTFIFKNGNEISIVCKNCKIKSINGTMTGYNLEGIETSILYPLHIDINEVIAVVSKPYCEGKNDDPITADFLKSSRR